MAGKRTSKLRREPRCLGCGSNEGVLVLLRRKWLKLDEATSIGVCSSCEDKVPVFERQMKLMGRAA